MEREPMEMVMMTGFTSWQRGIGYSDDASKESGSRRRECMHGVGLIYTGVGAKDLMAGGLEEGQAKNLEVASLEVCHFGIDPAIWSVMAS
jgi:hypothetical protein